MSLSNGISQLRGRLIPSLLEAFTTEALHCPTSTRWSRHTLSSSRLQVVSRWKKRFVSALLTTTLSTGSQLGRFKTFWLHSCHSSQWTKINSQSERSKRLKLNESTSRNSPSLGLVTYATSLMLKLQMSRWKRSQAAASKNCKSKMC